MIKNRFLAAAIVALPLTFGGLASAQTPARKPNIVMIMADDVGIWNISAYHRGMMGGSTPNIDRIAREGALFTDYYAQQSCTAGRAAFITRANAIPHRSAESRHAGRETGPAGQGSDDRRTAQALRLCHRADRQEPSRRPQRIPADGTRLRRVLRHSLPPQRDGRAVRTRLPEGRRNSSPCSVRATSWIARRRTTDDPTTDPRWGRVGKQTIADGGPLPPHPNMDSEGQVQHGRCRRRTGSPVRRFHRPFRQGRQAVLPLAQLHAHALSGPIFLPNGRTRAATASMPTP